MYVFYIVIVIVHCVTILTIRHNVFTCLNYAASIVHMASLTALYTMITTFVAKHTNSRSF